MEYVFSMISAKRIGGAFILSFLLSFQLPAAIVPLTLGTTYSGALSLPGETNTYTFTGVPGQRLYFDSLDADAIPMSVTLLSPGGAILYQNNDDYDSGLLALSEPGTYSLVLSGNAATTGNYQFRLLDLATAPPLTLGTTLSDQLSPPLACNIYQFNGTRGQRVNLQTLAHSTNQASWQLVSPANVVLASGQIYQNLGPVTLPINGAYCLMVIGTAPGSTPLTFQVLLSDVSDSPAVATGFGTTRSGTVNANQTNSFTYTAPAGLPVYFDSLDASGQLLEVDLFDPNGNQVFAISETSDAGPYVLARSGTYTLNVRGPGGGSGNFNFRLLDLTTSPVLPLNNQVSNVLAAPYQTDVYQLAGTAGQRLYYDSLVSTVVNVQVQLLGPDGLTPISGNFAFDEGPATLPFAGPYYLFFKSQLATSPAYVFQMFDVASQAALPLNTDLIGTLVPNTSLLYQLAGTMAEQLYFNGKGVSAGGASWTLYDGRNTQVNGANLTADFEQILPYACNYVLVLANGANPVSYTNQVNTFTYATSALTLGASISGNIVHPGDQLVYTFVGSAGQRVYYDALNGNYFPGTVTLVSPTGITVTSGSATSDFGPVTLTEPGTYTLILAGNGHTTGAISFQLLDVAAQPALPLNTDLIGTLPANTTLIYKLAGTYGESLYFNGKGVTAGGASWTLYGPDNVTVNGATLSQDFVQTLPYAGNYALVLQGGANTLSYTNQVNTITYTTNALTLGASISANIVHPGDQLVYTFAGTAGQRVYYDALNGNYPSINVTLVSPTGVIVTSGSATSDFGPLTLTEPGTYTLVLAGNGHTTGAISFQLLDVLAQPALPLNTDLIGTLPANSTVIYQLAGAPGEQLYFDAKGVTAGGANWNLYGPNNASVNGNALSQDFLQTLPYAGNWVLVIQGGPNSLSYTNQVNTFSYTTNALTLGTEATTSIVHPGDELYYTFNGTAGQRLYFDSRETNYFNVLVTLLSPTGVSILSQNASSDAGPFTLTQTGTYALVLNGSGHTTGIVAFNLLDLSAASLVTLGSTITDSLSDQTETRLYRFAGTAGQRVNLTSVGTGGTKATWELIGLADQLLAPSTYLSGNIGIVTLPVTGSYVVAVVGTGSALSPVPYQLTLSDVSDSSVAASGFGTVHSGNVAANQTNSFSYIAPAGLPVFFDSQDTSGQSLRADLIGPDGTLVFSGGETSDAGPYTLPRSGTYTLNVQGYNGASGNFSFRLLDLSASPSLSLNTAISGALSNPYETDVYQFTSSPGQTFIYNALTNDVNYPSVLVQMFDPSWHPIGPGGDFQNNRGPFNVQYSGTYYFLLRNNRNIASTYAFQLLDVSAQLALPINLALTNTLGVYALQVFRYAGTAGQQVFFNGQPGNPSGSCTLYDPNTSPVPAGSASLVGNFGVTLPFSGTYALVLANGGSTAGTEIFEVNSFSYITNSYTLGAPVVDAISQPGERRYYTFNGTIGQRVIYNALTNDPPSPNSINVQLLNPQGVAEGPIGGRFSFNRGPFALQESGTYSLVMAGGGSSTGALAFQLLDVSTQPPLPINTLVTKTLDVFPLQVYQYAGTAGQHLYFHAQAGNPAGSWTLYDPDNNQVSGGSASLLGDFEVTLSMPGTYALVLQNNSATSGTESFQVNDYSYFTNTYSIGTAVVDAINRRGEQRYYTFTGTIGQRLIYNALTNDPPSPNFINVQLLNPQLKGEGPIGGRFSFNRGPFALQESGTYSLVMAGSGSSTGALAFQLLDVSTQPPLPINTLVTKTLDVFPLQVYQYAGTAGQHLYFHAQAGNPGGSWTLYDPNNNQVSGGGTSLSGDFKVTLPISGTYALVLQSNGAISGTETFQVNLFDSGGPVATGFQIITVQIGPGTATAFWNSTAGKHYRLEFKNNLQDLAWTAVGADVAATGTVSSQVDSSIGINTSRFYRVQELP